MSDRSIPKFSRRRFLDWSLATSLVAGLTGCGKPKADEQHANWSFAVRKLDQFLNVHKQKHILVYGSHSDVALINFYQRDDFWEMLHSNGFTDFFVEVPIGLQSEITKESRERRSKLPPDPEGIIYRHAHKHGISTTAVDKSVDEEPRDYMAIVDGSWADFKMAYGISYKRANVANEIDAQASYYRRRYDDRNTFVAAEEAKLFSVLKLNDESTGVYAATAAQRSKGRIWEVQNSRHFTDCGLHTYLPNVVVLQFYIDEYEKLRTDAERKNSDVFVRFMPQTAPVDHYEFLLTEAELTFIPATKSTNQISDARSACLAQVQDPSKAVDADIDRYLNPQVSRPAAQIYRRVSRHHRQ